MQKTLEISKGQQRHTLSAKKKKLQNSFKNILAQPFPRYWPQISDAQSTELFEILKCIRDNDPQLFSTKKSEIARPFLYGLRTSIQKLKQKCAKILIMSADLKPRYVINQIILLALAKHDEISILCVSNLEEKIKSLVDFPCFAFVVTDDCSPKLTKLIDWCKLTITSHYPVPAFIQSYFKHRSNVELDSSAPMETNTSQEIIVQSENVSFDSLYLIKNNGNLGQQQRAFIPQNAINLKPLSFEVATSLGKDQSDFISLHAFDGDDKPIRTLSQPVANQSKQSAGNKWTKHKNQYQSVTINKIQGNVNKTQKNPNKKQKK